MQIEEHEIETSTDDFQNVSQTAQTTVPRSG